MPAAKKGKAKPAAKSSARKAAPAKKTPQAKKQAASAKRTNTMRSTGASSNFTAEDYSGKFTVRLPRSLHEALVDRAEQEGVSLNLFVTNALSRTVAGGGGKGKK
jgi:predicted HicB family RNase H-like nuclease